MTEAQKQQALMRRALEELRELRSKLAHYQQAEHEPIAVIGLGCRFPGGCDTPESLWRFLAEGNNARSEVPAELWSLADYFDETPQRPGKISSRYGAFLADIARFDADFFAISAREAEQMDPQQRLLLETSWQTFERTGIHPKNLRNSRTGVFIGCMTQEYSELIKDERAIDVHTGTGNAPSLLAGRLAYYYGLQGPAMVVDTACSSSLLAVHLAVKSLRSKEIDMALAGGINLQLSARAGITESQAMMLAEDGLCKTFDEKADGIGRGDGVGLVVLKRLTDAIQAGDPVCAVIKGSAANHDGRSSGLTVPSEKAQESVLQAALSDASLTPSQVSYVEAHGTGTSLGDPIEVSAMSSVQADRPSDSPLYVGSLKTNFGHMEGAAGIAGFIKTVLMLQNKMLPPHLNFSTPNSHIPWQTIPIKVVEQLMPWAMHDGQNRVAGVSAFGLSGTNVHVLLEQAPEQENQSGEYMSDSDIVLPLKLTAQSKASLTILAGSYQEWLQQRALNIKSMCYHAATGRADFNHRAVILGANKQQYEQGLIALAQGQTFHGLYVSSNHQQLSGLAVLFSGQGSQYPGMTEDLYQRWPVFKQTIDQCGDHLQDHLDISLQSLLFDSHEQQINQTYYAQPAIFSVDYALYRLWQSWGIEADAVMGHSLGEYVAACVAGVFSLKDALRLVVARAKIMQASDQGGMLAVSVGHNQLSELLADDLLADLDIASINSAQHCVLSGHKSLLEMAKQQLDGHGVNNTLLQVSHAFHSRMMESVLPALQQTLDTVTFNKPYMTLISNVTGQVVNDEMSKSDYWLQHCRQPVLFADGVQSLLQLHCTAFLECGAKPVLAPMLLANSIESSQVFSSVRPKQADSLLHCAARLYVNGFNLDWKQVFVDKPKGVRPVLPVYPFSGKRYWLSEQALKLHSIHNSIDKKQDLLHPLLHKRLALADSTLVYFESWLTPQEPAYLSEHQVFGLFITPLAVLLEMLLAAGQLLSNTTSLRLKKINIDHALVLSSDELTQVQIQARQNSDQQYHLSIFSRVGDEHWQRHITAVTSELNQSVAFQNQFSANSSEFQQHLSPEMLYQQFQEKDVVYGETFKVLTQIKHQNHSAFTVLKPVDTETGYCLHPVIWDGCMQTAGVALGETQGVDTWLPVAIDSIEFYQSNTQELECSAQVTVSEIDSAKVNLVLGCSGSTLVQMQGVTFQPVSREVFVDLESKNLDSWLYQPGWQLMSKGDFDSQTVVEKILCVGTKTAEQLMDQLQGGRGQLVLVSPDNLLSEGFWQHYKSAGFNAAQPLHIIFCAPDFVGQDESSACLGFLALIQMIEKQAVSAKVTLFTCHSAAIDNQPVCPKQSAVIGLLKTAALEFSQRQWLILDVDDINCVNRKLLAITLSGLANEQHLALHGEQCYAARLMPHHQTQSEHTVKIVNDKTYLVTGGSGALGFAVVEFLIGNGANCVVIAGRNGLSAVAEQKQQELAKQGVRIVGVAADLALQEGMDTLLDQLQSLPPLTGVVHAAGILNDAALLNMNPVDFNKPWAAKVKALQFLDKMLPVSELDFFVVFSSLAAITGAPGQGNYAAANAYADALMLNKRNQGISAMTINWGGWSGAGMSADAEAMMAEKGFDLVQPTQGIMLFKRMLNQSLSQVVITPVRWSEFFAALPFQTPNYYQQMLNVNVDTKQKHAGSLIRLLNQTKESQRHILLEQALRQLIAQVLHNPDSADLAARKRLFDMGFDSVLAMEFTRKLSQDLEFELPSTMLFDFPTLEALLNYLVENLPVSFKPKPELVKNDFDNYSDQELSDLLEQRLASLD